MYSRSPENQYGIVKHLKNRNGVASPCRTICTVFGDAPCYAFLSIQLCWLVSPCWTLRTASAPAPFSTNSPSPRISKAVCCWCGVERADVYPLLKHLYGIKPHNHTAWRIQCLRRLAAALPSSINRTAILPGIVKHLKNRNGVASPCRTTCTVCGDAPCYAFLSIQLYQRRLFHQR